MENLNANSREGLNILQELTNLKDRLFSIYDALGRGTRDLYDNVKIPALFFAYDALSTLNLTRRNKSATALATTMPVLILGAYDAVANPPTVASEVKDGQNLEYWSGIGRSLGNLEVSRTVAATPVLEDGRNGSNLGNSRSAQEQTRIVNYAEVPIKEVAPYLKVPDGKAIWWYDREANAFRAYTRHPVISDLTVIRDNELYWVPKMPDMVGTDPSTHKPKTTRLEKDWNLVHGDDILHPSLVIKYSIDTDGDGLSNWFEERFSKTAPLVRNERFFTIMNTWEDGKTYKVNPDLFGEEIYKGLVLHFGAKRENITLLEYKDANRGNFFKAIDDVAQKSTENDFAYIIWIAHGNVGYMGFQCGQAPSPYNSCDAITYEELAKPINKIKAKALVLFHDASRAETMLDAFKDGPTQRVIAWDGGRGTAGGFLNVSNSMHDLIIQWNNLQFDRLPRYGMYDITGPRYLEDEDGQLTLQEFSGYPRDFRADFDPHGLFDKVYFGEVNSWIPFKEFSAMKVD